MEILVSVIWTIASIVGLIGWILMLIAGFKRSVWWGLGIFLLLPIVGVIFAIKYWEDARLGCLLQIGATVVFFALMAMFTQQMMSMMGDDDMRALMQDVERQNQQQGGAGTATVQALPDTNTPAETESTAESATVESQPNPETMPQRQVTRRQFAFQDTDFDYLPSEVGTRVRIRTKDGREHEGVVLSAASDAVVLRKRIGGGTMEFTVKKSDAANVQVYEELQ